MVDNLKASISIASSGMKVQSERLKVISENIANADSIASKPGEDPYRRKTLHFRNVLDRELGINLVKVDKVGTDSTPFPRVFDPGNPAADQDGFVLRPNVNSVIESANLKEAQRSYEANLSTIDVTRSMLNRTLDLLR